MSATVKKQAGSATDKYPACVETGKWTPIPRPVVCRATAHGRGGAAGLVRP
jgi:hypothetical protein